MIDLIQTEHILGGIMMHRLEKVANDLQQAYDQYRGSVDRMGGLDSEVQTLNRQYKDLSPSHEGLQMGGAFVGSTALGAGAGALAGKKLLGSRLMGGTLGAVGGVALGGLAARGVRSYNDKSHPDRIPVRKDLSNKSNELSDEFNRFDDRQDDLVTMGTRNPSGVRAMLNPADEYDSWTDTLLSSKIRQQREAQEEMRQARLQQAQSQAAVNYSQHGLNAQQMYR